MRLIDGDKLIDIITNSADLGGAWGQVLRAVKDAFIRLIRTMPNVNPEPHWISCSEQLPEEKDAGILKKLGTSKRSDHVLITVDVKGDRMTDVGCTYDGVWHWDKKYAFPDWKVVAWMPLPEAWRGDAE